MTEGGIAEYNLNIYDLPVSIKTVECLVNQDLKVIVPYIKETAVYIQLMLRGNEQFIL
jgi:vacuolar-type H+-ATPase subunit D/Vma8